jgi:hypothetical protein
VHCYLWGSALTLRAATIRISRRLSTTGALFSCQHLTLGAYLSNCGTGEWSFMRR